MTLVYDMDSGPLPYKKRRDELPNEGTFGFENFPCFCGEKSARAISNTTRHATRVDVVQCLNCGTLRIDPYLNEDSLFRYYDSQFHEVKMAGISIDDLYQQQVKRSDLPFGFIKPYLKGGMSVLDYGCGPGGLMRNFVNSGFKVSGFEMDKTYMNYAVEQGLRRVDLGMKYDLIHISHVVEHFQNPVDSLIKIISSHLSDNGFVYIEVPTLERVSEKRRMKLLLHEFHIAHKYYFTSKSLILAAAMSGLDLVDRDGDFFLFRKHKEEDGGLERVEIKKSELMSLSNTIIRDARRGLFKWRFFHYLEALRYKFSLSKKNN